MLQGMKLIGAGATTITLQVADTASSWSLHEYRIVPMTQLKLLEESKLELKGAP